MQFDNLTDDNEIRSYLEYMTGGTYCMAQATHRKWGSKDSPVENGIFYQLMPHDTDRGFFNWYTWYRPYNQFFKSEHLCILHFLKFWKEWDELGRPEPDYSIDMETT